MSQLVTVLAVAVLGFAIQRGTVCTVLAVRQLLDRGRWERLAALLLAGAVAALVAAAAALAQGADRSLPGWSSTWGTVLGGVLFGLGATLNDGCALGTVAKLARGQIGFAAVVPGFVAGAWIGAATDLPAPGEAAASPRWMVWTFAVLVIGVWLIIRWRHPPRGTPWIAWRGSWSVDAAMLTIGLAAGVLLLLQQGWSYLDVLSDLAIHRSMPHGREIALFATLFLGSFGAACVARQLRWEVPTPGRLALHALGGCLMGLGARLLPGGNDALLLSGLPLLFLYAWIGVGAMVLTILAALALPRLIGRFEA